MSPGFRAEVIFLLDLDTKSGVAELHKPTYCDCGRGLIIVEANVLLQVPDGNFQREASGVQG